MLKKLGLALSLSVSAHAAGQSIWYVDDDALGGGDGGSWETAFQHLQDALGAASPGDQIRVAQGVYRPDESAAEPDGVGDRTLSFTIGDDLELLGGYRGLGGGDPDDNDPAAFETILSGDLDENDRPDFANTDDNSKHVVATTGVGADSLIDGFTIRDGCACNGPNVERRGAGIYHFGGSHTVSRCRIIDNKAQELGGGVYAVGPITVVDCIIEANLSQFHGGGMWSDKSGLTPASIMNTSFIDNSAEGGGGLWVFRGKPVIADCLFEGNDRGALHVEFEGIELTNTDFIGNSTLTPGETTATCVFVFSGPATLTDCTFADNLGPNTTGCVRLVDGPNHVEACSFLGNSSGSAGSAVLASPYTTITACDFEGNDADSGGTVGIIASSESEDATTVIEACSFLLNNCDSGGGGAIRFDDNAPGAFELLVAGCTFVGNTSGSSDSGTLYLEGGARYDIVDCLFQDNLAMDGAAMTMTNMDGAIVNCDFINNVAGDEGGALRFGGSGLGLRVHQCRFIGNTAGRDGGAIYADEKFLSLEQCLFTGNVAGDNADGGAVYLWVAGLQTSVTSCTFVANAAPEGDVGGFFFEEGLIGDVSNSIFWANEGEDGVLPTSQINADLAIGFVRNCCIDGAASDAFGNFGADPQFVLAAGVDGAPGTLDDDLRLAPDSPCIDAGDDGLVPEDDFDLDGDGQTEEPLPVDLNNDARFVDDPLSPEGAMLVDVGAYEYQTPTLVIFGFPGGLPDIVAPDAASTFIVSISAGDDAPESASILASIGGGDYIESPLTPLGGDLYEATLPAASCGSTIEYFLTADTTGRETATFPVYGEASPLSALAAMEVATVFLTDLEEAEGWTVGARDDDATAGVWLLDDPIGTGSQPEDDHTPDGSLCFFTGQGEIGGAQGDADVDGGATTLISPPIDLSNAASATLELWYWYSNLSGAGDMEDVFLIEASSDGSTWVLAEQIGPTGAVQAWKPTVIHLEEVIELTSTVQLRFIASDLGVDTIIEAAIDDLSIEAVLCEPPCYPDFNGDGALNILDFVAYQNAFTAMDEAADCNMDGSLNILDFVCFQNAFTVGCP